MSAETSSGKSRALPAIICAGLLCGVLDINAAFVTWWEPGSAAGGYPARDRERIDRQAII
jgi:hypothetical protein